MQLRLRIKPNPAQAVFRSGPKAAIARFCSLCANRGKGVPLAVVIRLLRRPNGHLFEKDII